MKWTETTTEKIERSQEVLRKINGLTFELSMLNINLDIQMGKLKLLNELTDDKKKEIEAQIDENKRIIDLIYQA